MAPTKTEKKKPFGEKIADILNYSALNAAIAIGYRTGLFDILEALGAPQTIDDISAASGANARYITEWLGIMTTGGIIEVSQNSDGNTFYHLPAEHAACLTRKAGSKNLAVYTQEIPLLTSLVFESIIKAFDSGEGLSYGHYPKFQAFMTELANQKHQRLLIDEFLPSVLDGKLVDQLQQGIEVCDLGCGEGVALLLMAQAFPQSRFTGIDISTDALAKARSNASAQQCANITFIQQDAGVLCEAPSWQNRFDYITAFDAIHDQTEPHKALQGIYHLLKPGGLFSMIDIAAESGHTGNLNHSMGPFLYTVSLLHCMPVGLYNNGAGLGMMWGRQKALEMLKHTGFKQIEVLKMDFDPFNYHYLARKLG
jgi:ubiquinone/menaquinone biosynthesis C-methylase UbiE